MYDGDDWLAVDKLYHVVFGFVIVVFVSLVAMRSRYSFLRRRAIELGCVVSILGGAAKEAADEVGIFRSAGASRKDAVADLVGVGIASILLLMWRRWDRPGGEHALTQEKEMSMV
uniref:VanZ-like domain-containing protein n=1 Tax=Kalanchoe fedtschenkoi TaxID=63787 RepID=A0A7N0TCT3_KALFE